MMDRAVYTERYIEQYPADSLEVSLVKVRRKQVLHTLSRYPHRHILEVGCGLEPLFLYVDDYDSYTVVEPSEAFVRNARRCASNAGKESSIRIVKGCLEAVYHDLVEEQAFDVVILSSLLHEVPDSDALVNAVYALCGAATVVHINVPNVYSFHRLLGVEMGLIEDIHQQSQVEADFFRHTRFSMASLKAMMADHGCEVLSSGTYFIKPFSNEQLAQMLKQQIVSPAVIEGLERMIKYFPDMGCEMYVEIRKERKLHRT